MNSAPVQNVLSTVLGKVPLELEIVCVGKAIRVAVLPFSLESAASGSKHSPYSSR